MKTRQELLAEAEQSIDAASAYYSEPQGATWALYAIACVMLAKERRESALRHPDNPGVVWDHKKGVWVNEEEANA